MDKLPLPNKDAVASSAIAPVVAPDASLATLVPMEIQTNKNDSARKRNKAKEAKQLPSQPDAAKINQIDQIENSEVALLEANASIREDQSENALDAPTNREENKAPSPECNKNIQ